MLAALKIINKFFIFLLLGLGSLPSIAQSPSLFLNVYLKPLPNNTITSLTELMEQELKADSQLNSLNIHTFYPKHPIHLTLYLTEYAPQQIKVIKGLLEAMAPKQNKLKLHAKNLILSDSLYLMLDMQNTSQLQYLSDYIVQTLSPLRFVEASIPNWARRIPAKVRLFKLYGSPNVYQQFHPHFSILTASHLSIAQQKVAHKLLQRKIEVLASKYPFQQEIEMTAIGLGIANAQGQIIKELASYTLF